jgi:hypothetical protein
MRYEHLQASRVARAALVALALTGATAACDDPIDPSELPALEVAASSSSFRDAELAVGTDETILVRVQNAGGGPLTISRIAIQGADAGAFAIVEGGMPGRLAPGGSRDVRVSFLPTSEGAKTAVLSIESDDPADAEVQLEVSGRAERFQYRQVDRFGIATLNTVFNHPSGVAGFSKRAYNLASPEHDLATYRTQFETVLGAVANPNPSATAALLLPDELPVNMGAAVTRFAELTGRALADDAVDVALSVTVGIASLQSDNVDGNDKAFRTAFPYVAAPHP